MFEDVLDIKIVYVEKLKYFYDDLEEFLIQGWCPMMIPSNRNKKYKKKAFTVPFIYRDKITKA